MPKTKQSPSWEPTGDTFIARCDEKDCRYNFHQYAVHSDLNSNRLLVTDMDGNDEFETDSHLDCITKEEVWLDYVREVAQTGDDYLGSFTVKQSRKQTWSVTLANWLGNKDRGLLIVRGRRVGRKSVTPDQFPLAVSQYLEMVKGATRFTTKAVHSVDELKALQSKGDFRVTSTDRHNHTRIRFTLDVPFTQNQNKRAVMKVARKRLQLQRAGKEQPC